MWELTYLMSDLTHVLWLWNVFCLKLTVYVYIDGSKAKGGILGRNDFLIPLDSSWWAASTGVNGFCVAAAYKTWEAKNVSCKHATSNWFGYGRRSQLTHSTRQKVITEHTNGQKIICQNEQQTTGLMQKVTSAADSEFSFILFTNSGFNCKVSVILIGR